MRDEYYHWVHAAIRYIEGRLGDGISLQDIADSAGYSVFHFGRIFQGITGESVMEYVRKRRLTEAAAALVRTDRRILDIAMDWRYESQEAFTRSFKRAYGVTPGAYRRRRHYLPLRLALTPAMLRPRVGKGAHMEPGIVEMPAMRVIGLAYTGKNEAGEIPALWDQFNQRAAEVQGRPDRCAYIGVCSELYADGTFTHVAGCQVTADAQVPEGMVAVEIPAGTYAVFTHHGPLFGVPDDLSTTYQAIYRDWLPTSGYQRAATPDFELYDERFRFGAADSAMDICIPVVR